MVLADDSIRLQSITPLQLSILNCLVEVYEHTLIHAQDCNKLGQAQKAKILNNKASAIGDTIKEFETTCVKAYL